MKERKRKSNTEIKEIYAKRQKQNKKEECPICRVLPNMKISMEDKTLKLNDVVFDLDIDKLCLDCYIFINN